MNDVLFNFKIDKTLLECNWDLIDISIVKTVLVKYIQINSIRHHQKRLIIKEIIYHLYGQIRMENEL